MIGNPQRTLDTGLLRSLRQSTARSTVSLLLIKIDCTPWERMTMGKNGKFSRVSNRTLLDFNRQSTCDLDRRTKASRAELDYVHELIHVQKVMFCFQTCSPRLSNIFVIGLTVENNDSMFQFAQQLSQRFLRRFKSQTSASKLLFFAPQVHNLSF